MPRIPNDIVDCAFYLYRDDSSAREGRNFGGSGFLVHVNSKVAGHCHSYAITNKHVVYGAYTVLRLNRKAGDFDVIITRQSEWFTHPKGDEIAILPIDIMDSFKHWSVGLDYFLTHQTITTFNIGLGDEVFLVGRLITHGGSQRNTPVVRFGNISLMADPAEPIRTEGGDYEGFLVECRSLSGFSGSPVFVTTTQTYSGENADLVMKHLQEDELLKGANPQVFKWALRTFENKMGPWLLGVDWGHIPLWKHVFQDNKPTTDLKVEANTGIACVAPAWKILEVLEIEELVKARNQEDIRLAAKVGMSVPDPNL